MKITLDHIVQEAPNITSFYFKTEQPIRYVAGQFIEMTLPHNNPDERGIKHWFTLSSAPGYELISVTTKHAEKPSTFKQTLWKLNPGDSIEISEPMGDFVLPKDSTIPLVFVAGGIGITPFHSVVQWLLDNKEARRIKFIYSLHSENEEIFKDTFNQPFIDKLVLVNQPQLTASRIVELADGVDDKQIFISGPEPMTEDLVAQFKDLGINQDQLITDYFPGYSTY